MGSAERMVDEIRGKYHLDAPKVLSVMTSVPRHEFVPQKHKDSAYDDGPVPIGFGQTMSQPYTVAFMTHLLNLKGSEKVLEIGTGSGYQAAVLSQLARQVYTVEIIPRLAKHASGTLKRLGYKNVHVRAGSGEWGWKENAPYDAIVVTAGLGDKVPESLFNQLKVGGSLVAPIGEGADKTMIRYTKFARRVKKEKFGVFHFVPFVHEAN